MAIVSNRGARNHKAMEHFHQLLTNDANSSTQK